MFNNSISQVTNENNMDFMKRCPDGFFDLAVVDPPYGINAEHGTNRASRKQFKDAEIGWDAEIPDIEYFIELFRVSKNQIIWGGNYFLHHIRDVIGEKVNCRCFITWDKLNPDRNFADCEFAWTSFDEVARIYKEKRVQELNRLDGGKIHPTQKPVRLYHWIFQRYAKKGMKILDTHLGSGSSRIAAHINELDFYAQEKSKFYFDAQNERFEKYKEEYKLFIPESSKKDDNKILSIEELDENFEL